MAETKINRQIHNLQLVKKKAEKVLLSWPAQCTNKVFTKKTQKYKDKQTNEYVPGARMSGREYNIFV